ncbi:3-phosphoglycerate dehydrogenase [Microvirga sp. KLBC 81]|uniref:2-hydroxyacid dehydrogenase n=1 Tax=Microvirga sp. KLBC 81 TaxID=1862707 RepID=UPI000D50C2FD|nr:2-hydroxyacid dehydrogenase [Microvirga sp. KLBC 81]PVE24774.1 3-phosphoglycerate dehydrogenase [Microvirga sp. KLBC 81]
MASSAVKVFYNSLGTPEIYALMQRLKSPSLELVLLEADDDEERVAKVRDCEAIIAAATPLTRRTIEAAPRLRFVQHQGVGYHDTVDVPALVERGIRLAVSTAGTIGVAEHAVMLALAAARRLTFADPELRRGQWHANRLRPVSIELAGKTVGYVGMGRIGQAAAERFRGFQTRGLYSDPNVRLPPEREAALGLEPASLERILREADFVTLHLPLTSETRNLIGRDELALMKPNSILINTARGGIVNEAALVEALKMGRPGAAGIDVFETEPMPADHPLATLPNTVLTPHIAAGTWDSFVGKMDSVLSNIDAFFDGRPLQNEIVLGSTA